MDYTTSEHRANSRTDSMESLNQIATMLKPVAATGLQLLMMTSRFARRNPIKLGLAVFAIGYIFNRITKSKPAGIPSEIDKLH